ncbi:MAG: Cell division protein FtsA [Bacteroidetes bacterium ADurb.BinA104]|nr:MAG: Cell division protein FtsA [Bacteroidetes bacterium ADurb.BinA104]
MHDEEREIGAAVLDFGAGLCELTIWEKQGLVYTAVIPVGGHNITEDIAAGLSTPIAVAEELKVTQGHAYNTSYTNGTTIQVRGAGGRGTYNYHINNLYMIIEVRFIEIFSHVRSQLANYGINDSLPGGLVLTGGASKMPGLIDAADEALNMSVRIGIPRDVKELSTILNDPAMATSYGLLVCASMRYNTEIPRAKLPGGPPQQRGLLKEIVRKVKGFTI